MTDKQWIAIDPSPFRQPVEQKIGTATVVTSTSPYSVPQALTTYVDKQAGQYVFEIRYIGPDEPVETLTSENLSVLRGKNSGRVLKVFVPKPPQPMDRHHLFQTIKTAIERVASKYGSTDNFRIVSAVIDQNENRLAVASGLDEDANKKL